MQSDFKFLLILFLSILLPFVYFLFSGHVPKSSNYTHDIHINFYETQLEKKEDPDIVFFGTSKTMNNIRTDLINENSKLKSVNLGINWFGLGIQSHLIKRWLKNKKPKIVVLEVPLLLRYAPHPHFSKLATAGEISVALKKSPVHALKSSVYFSPRLLYQYTATKLEFTKYDSYMDRENNSGFLRIGLSEAELLEAERNSFEKLKMGQKTIAESSSYKALIRDYLYAHHNAFLAQIKENCAKMNIKLVILPLVKLNLQKPDPYLNDFYKEFEELLEPPISLQRADYWRDSSHMNVKGSTALTTWLNKELKRILLKL